MQDLMRLVQRSLHACDEGRNLDAIRGFRKAVKRRPRHIAFRLVLGDLEQGEELYAAAERSYRRALGLLGEEASIAAAQATPDPFSTARTSTMAGLHRSLGIVLACMGNFHKAEIELRRALELEPVAENHVSLGEVLDLKGRCRESRACFLRALRVTPGHVEATYRLGCHHLWFAPQRAERLMRRVVARDPSHGLALSALGLLCGRRCAWEEADRYLEQAIALGTAGALPHVYRGHHALHCGRSEEAMAAYEAGRRVAPEDAHPYFAIGDLYRLDGKLDEAREAYEAALRLDPVCGDAALRLGYLHEDEGRTREARRYFERGLALTPQHPWAEDVRRRLTRSTG